MAQDLNKISEKTNEKIVSSSQNFTQLLRLDVATAQTQISICIDIPWIV